jgi:adenine deaminase
MLELKGNIVDVAENLIYPGKISVQKGKIKHIKEIDESCSTYLLPGFIDGHIHIDSSMLCPQRFAETIIPHGTTSVVSDPHEIANVMGLTGIEYMIKDSEKAPLNVYFTAPSCVPATPFETTGAVLGVKEIELLLKRSEIVALGEMMNVPGVIKKSEDVMAKIEAAKKAGKPIDGHAPLLSGTDLKKYISAGISTDHECTNLREAQEKAKLGMKIMIREGSASKDLEALAPLASEFDNCMLVTDDKDPKELQEGHLDTTLAKAVKLGIDSIRAVAMVTINPARHYNLERGVLDINMPADIVEVNNLQDFKVLRVYIEGELAAEAGRIEFETTPTEMASSISVPQRTADDFNVLLPSSKDSDYHNVRIIEIIPDNIVTRERIESMTPVNGILQAEPDRDILKLAVVNRYTPQDVSKGFIKGLGMKKGAFASSVAHDSHNIIVAGVTDSACAKAVNTVIANQGGFAVVDDKSSIMGELELPIGGLMCSMQANEVVERLQVLHDKIKELGCELTSPLSTLSFMSLEVIPELKLSDKGLFDSRSFQFVELIEDSDKVNSSPVKK